jgi:hypothetical protein
MERAVGAAVAYYANRESGLAFPSNECLMREWGLSERTIQRGLRSLEDRGLLRRVPEFESPQRPRVYLVGSGQLSILDDPGQGAKALAPASWRPSACHPPATRARVEGTEELNSTPQPPKGGTPELLEGLQQSGHALSAVQGAAVARRRRRRRRPDEQGSVASEPCPRQHSDAESDPELEALWAELDARLRERFGQLWEVWGHGAHPHRRDDDAVVVAFHPATVGWVHARFVPVLAQAAGAGLQVVGCEGLR